MTTKEKAKDLFDMFNYKNDILFHQLDKEGAKQCALIAVDEIINHSIKWIPEIDYWVNVKKEIEKL